MKVKLIWTFIISVAGMSTYSLVWSQTNYSTATPVGLNKKPPVISVDSNTMTYINSEYGFQFQYPKSIGSTIVNIQRNQNDWVYEVLTNKVVSNNFDPNIEIDVYRNENGNSDILSLKNKVMKFYGVSSWSKILTAFPGGVSKTSEINVNGHKAIKINYNQHDEISVSGTPAVLVYISNKKYIFKISFFGNLKKVDQILGAFKIYDN